MFQVVVKSGTNGYSDYDNCDLVLANIESENIPNVGDNLLFGDQENRNPVKYLVREVKRSYNFATDSYGFGEFIYVYVINA